MLTRLFRKLFGRDIRGIAKRVTRMQADITANIENNDKLIADASEAISALKLAQDKLMAENTTGRSMRDSITVIAG